MTLWHPLTIVWPAPVTKDSLARRGAMTGDLKPCLHSSSQYQRSRNFLFSNSVSETLNHDGSHADHAVWGTMFWAGPLSSPGCWSLIAAQVYHELSYEAQSVPISTRGKRSESRHRLHLWIKYLDWTSQRMFAAQDPPSIIVNTWIKDEANDHIPSSFILSLALSACQPAFLSPLFPGAQIFEALGHCFVLSLGTSSGHCGPLWAMLAILKGFPQKFQRPKGFCWGNFLRPTSTRHLAADSMISTWFPWFPAASGPLLWMALSDFMPRFKNICDYGSAVPWFQTFPRNFLRGNTDQGKN